MNSWHKEQFKEIDMNHKDRDHAVFSPSSMERILKCPGSIKLSEGIPEETSEEATEGTKAHEIAEYYVRKELCLENIIIPEEDNEMHHHGQDYRDFIVDLLDEFKPTAYFVEQKVVLDELCWGTVDFLAYRLNDDMTMDFLIVDYKYGQGDTVYAENNKQLMTYALCASNTFKGCSYTLGDIKAYIFQPRKYHISETSFTKKDIYILGNDIEMLISGYNFDNNNEINAEGLTHCKWCKAKPICKAFKEETNKSLKIVNNTLPNPDLLNDEEMVKIFHMSTPIKDFLNKVEQNLYNKSLETKVDGVKLVEGRSVRVLEDTKETVEYFKKHNIQDPYIITKKFIGIGEAKTKLKEQGYRNKDAEEIVSNIAKKTEPKLKLVDDNDKRLAVLTGSAKKLMTNI